MKLFYKNNISSLNKLASDIEIYAKENNIPPAVAYALNLCLDEVLTNIISYSLKGNHKDSSIEMDLSISDNQIVATMYDNGYPFNPLENSPRNPDTYSRVEERPIGGLGIYFIEQYMDKVEYKRDKNKNILKLSKKLTSSDKVNHK